MRQHLGSDNDVAELLMIQKMKAASLAGESGKEGGA